MDVTRLSLLMVMGLVPALAQISTEIEFSGSSDCVTKKPICVSNAVNWTTGSGPGIDLELMVENNTQVGGMGGIGSCSRFDREVNSSWYYFYVSSPGEIKFDLVSYQSSDLNYVLWGPFPTMEPASTCGANLNSTIEADCGWQPGPSTLAFLSVEPYSLERVTMPVGAVGYYTLLVNDLTGNGTFYLRSVEANGTISCDFLNGPTSYNITATGNATVYGFMPDLGSQATVTFYGINLNLTKGGDEVKTVAATSSCSEPAYGVDRPSLDLGPDDSPVASYATWNFTFLTGGDYKFCYKPYGKDFMVVGVDFTVQDPRPRPPAGPPVGLMDAAITNTDVWIDVSPRTLVSGGPTTFTFTGFEAFGYPKIEAKVVVEHCHEEYQSVQGGAPTLLDELRRATFQLSMIGRYKVCVKHRAGWEVLPDWITVTTADMTQLYHGYQSCAQTLHNSPDYCGCFFQPEDTSTMIMPMETNVRDFLGSPAVNTVNQGCCGYNTVKRETFSTPDGTWGLCSEKM